MRLIDAEYLLYGMGMFSERENGAEFMKGAEAVAKMIEEAETVHEPDDCTPCAEGMPTKVHALKNPEQCTFRVRSVKDGHGDTERGNDWCNGYQKSEVDDEPCLTCQACKLCAANDQEED